MPSEDSFSFADFIKPQEESTSPTEQAETAEAQEVLEEGTEANPLTEDSEVESEATAPIQEQATPSQAERLQFEDVLRQRGAKLDDELDPQALYETAADRIMAATQTAQENERLRAELESLRSGQQPAAAPQPQPTPQEAPQQLEPETQAEARARRFRELHRPDPTLNNYVDRNEQGLAVPKEGYGTMAVDAARQINDYERATQEQADLILQNPALIIDDNMDRIEQIALEKATAIAEAKLNAFQTQYEQQSQQQAEAARKAEEQKRISEWQESHKDKLFRVNPQTGELLQDVFGSGELVTTETGKQFFQNLESLRYELPESTPELKLYDLAWKLSSAAEPQTAPTQPAATQAPEVLTQAEQKQRLAERRSPVPNQNTPVATEPPAHESRRPLRFAELASRLPENAERIASW